MILQQRWRQRSRFGGMIWLGVGLVSLTGLTGCGERKGGAVAQNATPPTASQPGAPAAPDAPGAAPDPHPWIGNKPPPGSALPPGGPKIPQK